MRNKISSILKNRNGTTITLKDFEPLIITILVLVFAVGVMVLAY